MIRSWLCSGLAFRSGFPAADEKMIPPRPFAAFRHETNLSIQKNRAIIYYQHNNYLKSELNKWKKDS